MVDFIFSKKKAAAWNADGLYFLNESSLSFDLLDYLR
jgi:hypothetical protein